MIRGSLFDCQRMSASGPARSARPSWLWCSFPTLIRRSLGHRPEPHPEPRRRGPQLPEGLDSKFDALQESSEHCIPAGRRALLFTSPGLPSAYLQSRLGRTTFESKSCTAA